MRLYTVIPALGLTEWSLLDVGDLVGMTPVFILFFIGWGFRKPFL